MPRFFADDMVGKLARLLRLSGFDCLYVKQIEDAALARKAEAENRVVLTRDTHFEEKYPCLEVLTIESTEPRVQILQVKKAYSLDLRQSLFTRCLECNSELQQINKQEVRGKVPAYVFGTQEEFFQCPDCQRIYWAGSHHDRMRERLEQWLSECEQ